MKTMGRAFDVDAGQVLRVSQLGEQGNVADIMFLNCHNLDEHNELHTQLLHEGFLLTKYTRIWASQPYMRPLAVCIEDATDKSYLPTGYGNHKWIGHCTPEMIEIAADEGGRLNASSCHTNFLQAVQQRCLGEEIARLPNANLFQPATYKAAPNGQVMGYADVPTQTKQGDCIDFNAQMDLLILTSLCPCGDDSAAWKEVMLTPMKCEVFDTGTTPPEFKRFHNWRPHFKDTVVPQD